MQIKTKIISIVLTALLLCSLFVLPTFAFSVNEGMQAGNGALLQALPSAVSSVTYMSQDKWYTYSPDYTLRPDDYVFGSQVQYYSVSNAAYGNMSSSITLTEENGYAKGLFRSYFAYPDDPYLMYSFAGFKYYMEGSDYYVDPEFYPRVNVVSNQNTLWRAIITDHKFSVNGRDYFGRDDHDADIVIPLNIAPTSTLSLSTEQIIDAILTEYGFNPPNDEVYIDYIDVLCYPVDSEGVVNIDMSIVRFDTEYYYITRSIAPWLYRYSSVVTTLPPDVDGASLLGWIGDALTGFLDAPLFPLGDFTVTIGGICSALLGISLVIVFLKIFLGG